MLHIMLANLAVVRRRKKARLRGGENRIVEFLKQRWGSAKNRILWNILPISCEAWNEDSNVYTLKYALEIHPISLDQKALIEEKKLSNLSPRNLDWIPSMTNFWGASLLTNTWLSGGGPGAFEDWRSGCGGERWGHPAWHYQVDTPW